MTREFKTIDNKKNAQEIKQKTKSLDKYYTQNQISANSITIGGGGRSKKSRRRSGKKDKKGKHSNKSSNKFSGFDHGFDKLEMKQKISNEMY